MQPQTHSSDTAGRELAEQLSALSLSDVVIVAISPQSVSFAFEAAQRLGCELDLLLVGRINAPGHPETAIGSVIDLEVPQVVIDEALARAYHVPPGYLNTERQRQLSELERRHVMYLGDGDGASHKHAGKDVVVVDDGLDAAVLQLVIQRLGETGASSVRVVHVRSDAHEQIDDRAIAHLLKEARRIHKLVH